MFSATPAAVIGALGGIWRQRTIAGALPGALVAMAWYGSVHCFLAFEPISHPWAIPGALAPGAVAALFAGPRRGKWIDIPLDGRIGLALFTGFLIRGFLLSFDSAGLRRICCGG